MFANSFRNCNDFFRTRPPAVVFLICLVTLMLTTFSFTIYITHSDKIVNSDAQQNWKSLSEHLDNLDLCFGNSSYKPTHLADHYVEEISFVTFVQLNLTNFNHNGASTIQAYYDLKNWRPNCPYDYNGESTSVIKANFVVPQIINNTALGKVCAIVQGPKQYLPEYSEPLCDPHSVADKAAVTTLYSKSASNSRFCISDASIRLSFNAKDNAYRFSIFLGESEQNIIYVHLMWCSYFLLFVILVVLLYVMFFQAW